MEFFSNVFEQTKELNKITNGVANVTNLLNRYEDDNDLSFLYMSAWICRVAIIDVVESNNFPMNYKLFVPFNGVQRQITLDEAYMLTITRLMSKANERGESISSITKDILDNGINFDKLNSQIPYEQKKIFQ